MIDSIHILLLILTNIPDDGPHSAHIKKGDNIRTDSVSESEEKPNRSRKMHTKNTYFSGKNKGKNKQKSIHGLQQQQNTQFP